MNAGTSWSVQSRSAAVRMRTVARKLFLLAVGVVAVGYVFSRRRPRSAGPSENGSPLASSHDVRRAVGEARQRIEAEAESR